MPALDRDRTSRRVLFYSDAPYEGGAERYIEYLISEFPPALEVHVAAPSLPTLSRWTERLATRGVGVTRIGATGAQHLRGLARAVRTMRPDVVHLNMPHSYAASFGGAGVVAKAAGARSVVATEHLTMIAPMRLRGRMKQLFAHACDRIITLSESNRRDLVNSHRLPSARVRVVMNGVPDPMPVSDRRRDASRVALVGDREGVVIVHVGALTERKGHRTLLTALSQIRDHPWALACVGEGEDRQALEILARDLGIGDRVTFTGRLEDVPAVLAASDLVTLPSRVEGIPLVLLEALAVGKPAVATRIFGVPEIYADSRAATLVNIDDPAGLARAIARYLGDRALREAAGDEARRLYETRFTARHMADRTLAVYDEVWA